MKTTICGIECRTRKLTAGHYLLLDDTGTPVGCVLKRNDDWYAEAAIGLLYFNASGDSLGDALASINDTKNRIAYLRGRGQLDSCNSAHRLRAKLAKLDAGAPV